MRGYGTQYMFEIFYQFVKDLESYDEFRPHKSTFRDASERNASRRPGEIR